MKRKTELKTLYAELNHSKNEVKKLAKQLKEKYCDDNIKSIGTAYGLTSDSWKDRLNPIYDWHIRIYAVDPIKAAKKIPHEINGYAVLFYDIPKALTI